MENKKMTYEEAMLRITEIASKLEKNDTALEESLALFEEGVGLVKYAQSLLSDAERRVNVLTKGEI